MGRQEALDAVRGESAGRFAHTEYSLEYHRDHALGLTGADPGTPEDARALMDAWGVDFIWSTQDGLHDDWATRGRATDMGHAVYAADGADRRDPTPSPFRDVRDVWAFDAVAEYGLPSREEQVAEYRRLEREARRRYPEQLSTGGYYKTLVSGAIQAFGWDMFLEAAADPHRLDRVFDGFFRRTLFHMEAWAQTEAPVVIQHDDFVWSSGPFLHPEHYRSLIIPRYAELWKPLKRAGKHVLFCSDGLWMELAPDILEAGADGLIFEPCNDFVEMARRFGRSCCLVSSAVDCRDLTFGTWEKVERDLDKTFRALEGCRGAIVAVGNHLPPNIAPATMERYRRAVLGRLGRRC